MKLKRVPSWHFGGEYFVIEDIRQDEIGAPSARFLDLVKTNAEFAAIVNATTMGKFMREVRAKYSTARGRKTSKKARGRRRGI